MAMIIGGWVFISFVYFKMAFGSPFDETMGVIGSLVLAISFGAMVFGFTGLYAKRLLADNLGVENLSTGKIISRTLPTFFMFYIALMVWSLIVLEGFAEGVAYEIEISRLFRGRFDGEHLIFFFVCFVPVAVHYFMVVFSSAYRKAGGIMEE